MSTNCTALVTLLAILSAVAALGDQREERIRALEQRVEQLEKLLRVEGARSNATVEASASAPPKAAPALSIGASGFTLRSADTNFLLRVRGLLQLDSRWSDDGAFDDSFLVRRARLGVEGIVFRDFDFRLTPEFAGSSPTLRDAWLNYRYNGALELRVGKMKPPGSLERWQSVAGMPFIERGLVSLLWPVRDVGVVLHGELWPGEVGVTKSLAANGLINYDLGLLNGVGDARAAGDSDFDGDMTGAGRLFFHPFLRSDLGLLRTFGLGVSGTHGEMSGDAGLPNDIDYRTDFTADGLHWRIGPQAYWYAGPFGLLGEYAISSQRVERKTAPFDSTRVRNSAWAITASWLFTGEDATFRGPVPKRNFNPRAGGWGALELVARYSSLDIDDDLFPAFANPAELPTRAAAWGVGLNWYLNRNIRTSFNYTHTRLTGGQRGSVTDFGEHAFLTRVQLAF